MRHCPLLIPVMLAGIMLSTRVANAAGVQVTMRSDDCAAGESPRSDIEPTDAAVSVDFIPQTLAAMVDTIEQLSAAPVPTDPAPPKSTPSLSDPTITDGIADHEMQTSHPSDYDPPRIPFATVPKALPPTEARTSPAWNLSYAGEPSTVLATITLPSTIFASTPVIPIWKSG